MDNLHEIIRQANLGQYEENMRPNTISYNFRFLLLIIGVALAFYTSIGLVYPRQDDDSLQKTMDTAISAVKPSLVRLHVVEVDYEEGREVKHEAVGSGVIISKEGHIITNHHVAGHATQITCTMADKSEIDAELIGTDAMSDIAVIKLLPQSKTQFPVARFGNSDAIKVGDTVFSMGSPLAFSQSVTQGIVSNTELVMPGAFGSLELDGEDVGSIVRWIAHDAQIYPGNSGGPLVNMQGEIIGINEIQLGLGGAIPGNLANSIAEQLIKNGKVRRSWIGFSIQSLLKSSNIKNGVLISGTIEGSPARAAGFQAGDILLKLDNKDCTVRFAEELPLFNQLVLGLTIGKEILATVLRDGKEVSLKVTPIERQDARARPRELKQWGLCASNINFLKAKEIKRADLTGVIINNLRPGGPANDAKPRLSGGDIIVEVAGKPIRNIDEISKLTDELTNGKEEPVPTLVTFERNKEKYLTVVKLGIRDIKDRGLEVRKAWLPVGVQVLTNDISEALGLEDRTGVRVTQVYPGTTAEQAGLKTGDIIVALDDQPIPASEPEDVDVFPAMVRQYKIGSNAELTIIRDGKESKLSAMLPESPKLQREMKKYKDESFEFTVRDIAFIDRIDEQLPQNQAGVIVDSVEEGGWASLGGLSSGAVIVSVDGNDVKDVASFETLMKEISTAKRKITVLKVKHGILDRFVELKPNWAPN